MNRITSYLILILSALFLSAQAYNFILLNTDTFVIYKFELVKTVVAPGEPLTIYYDYYRKRICKTDVVRSILGDVNKNVYRKEFPGGATPVGRLDPPLTFNLDIGVLPEGCYRLYNFTYSECSEGRHDFADPPQKFCVKSHK